MLTQYRIESVRYGFLVMDDRQEKVGVYKTRQEAELCIKWCQQEDRVCETAAALIENSIESLMKMYDIDRYRARYWIWSAAECSESLSGHTDKHGK